MIYWSIFRPTIISGGDSWDGSNNWMQVADISSLNNMGVSCSDQRKTELDIIDYFGIWMWTLVRRLLGGPDKDGSVMSVKRSNTGVDSISGRGRPRRSNLDSFNDLRGLNGIQKSKKVWMVFKYLLFLVFDIYINRKGILGESTKYGGMKGLIFQIYLSHVANNVLLCNSSSRANW